ncbi:hypothetical protein CI109_103762 [Kwoniella shandongensis]|uniref:[histone H3]-dimethyl-L-lysine(36) demethylase n=1 Tax=Kwoniella shandongensis TaxID=1734106 RepID=A0A5M6CCZ0_9TREE|nr:uncharacterized protein CI109_000541 [Kwoniella shandongensis]KAA5530969.1 hypothetical protein CI109_000541 [Kwoniella shandongensis]
MSDADQSVPSAVEVTLPSGTASPEKEQETCPLCPASGPPIRSTSTFTTGDIETALVWIACTKCSTWYHSACLFLGDEKSKGSVPRDIVDEVEKRYGEEGAWFNWTEWIDKWYCMACLARSTSPSNPRPPRHPLTATVKKGVLPFHIAEIEGAGPKRSASSTSLATYGGKAKKARMSSSSRQDVTASPEASSSRPKKVRLEADHGNAEEVSTSGEGNTNGHLNGDSGQMDSPQLENGGRPKRNVVQLDYNNLNNSIATPTTQWLDLIANPAKTGRTILDADYPRIPGKLVTKAWLESSSSSSPNVLTPDAPSPTCFYGPDRQPIIIRPEDGGFSSLGGHIPGKDLTVQEVARLVGPKKMVDVIDVSSQHSSQWTIQKWADYLDTASSASSSTRNPKVYNIISLEISDTELGKKVKPPKLVREIDWVDNFWNFEGSAKSKAKGKGKQSDGEVNGHYAESNGNSKERSASVDGSVQGDGISNVDGKEKSKAPYPKVQLYCLMGMRGAWTDWHVDFAASSVYYTIHTGSKVFYFIRPTPDNLAAYAKWSGSYERQQDTWLGDMVDEVRKVVLKAGDTMIIPSGYIHAVYTPMDSIVFGGNFLHSYDIDTQLRLRQIEIDTKVPQRFRFPMFDRLCWYVADKYCAELRHLRSYRVRAPTHPPQPPHFHVLKNLTYLASFLISQTDILIDNNAEDKRRKLVHDRIPAEVVKDAEGLARELKWRVERELPVIGLLDEEAEHRSGKEGSATLETRGKGKGRSMLEARKENRLGKIWDKKPVSRTWKFDPEPWTVNVQTPPSETSHAYLPRPTSSIFDLDVKQEGGEEKARLTISSTKQSRRRVRETEDGVIVEESQEVTFTEKRMIWGMSEGEEEGEKMEVD